MFWKPYYMCLPTNAAAKTKKKVTTINKKLTVNTKNLVEKRHITNLNKSFFPPANLLYPVSLILARLDFSV